MCSWQLEDVTAAARLRPDSFFIPSLEERLSVEVGRLARLHFLLVAPGPEEPRAERIWVDVQDHQMAGGSVRYSGVLTNQPKFISGLNAGDRIEFGAEHIAQLILPEDHRAALEIGEKAALVSAMVLEPGDVTRFAYREGADREEDSCWRLFAGGESDDYVNDALNVRVCNTLRLIFRSPEGQAFERPDPMSPWARVLDWEGGDK